MPHLYSTLYVIWSAPLALAAAVKVLYLIWGYDPCTLLRRQASMARRQQRVRWTGPGVPVLVDRAWWTVFGGLQRCERSVCCAYLTGYIVLPCTVK